jgi:hypothetical protein
VSLFDNRKRTNCSACGQRYQSSGVQILVHEMRAGHGVWVWQHRWLCPPCRVAHLDVILGEPRRQRRRTGPEGFREEAPGAAR